MLWGPRDPIFSDRYLRDLMDRLPHAHVHRFEGAGHLVAEDRTSPPPSSAGWATTGRSAKAARPKRLPRPRGADALRRREATDATSCQRARAETYPPDARPSWTSAARTRLARRRGHGAPGRARRRAADADLGRAGRGRWTCWPTARPGSACSAGDRISLLVPPGRGTDQR